MLIKYNGDKSKKTFQFNSPEIGLKTYVFEPFCDIPDEEEDCIAFLLSQDRLGLFSDAGKSAKNKKASKGVESKKELEEESKPKKKRGRKSRGE